MAEITVKTKVPLTSGKEATFTLEDGEVAMKRVRKMREDLDAP